MHLLILLLAAAVAHAAPGDDEIERAMKARKAGRDSEKIRLVKKAVGKGNARAMSMLGSIHENGGGVPRDFRQALHWFRQAADHGHTAALWDVGRLLGHGPPEVRDTDAAIPVLEKILALSESDVGARIYADFARKELAKIRGESIPGQEPESQPEPAPAVVAAPPAPPGPDPTPVTFRTVEPEPDPAPAAPAAPPAATPPYTQARKLADWWNGKKAAGKPSTEERESPPPADPAENPNACDLCHGKGMVAFRGELVDRGYGSPTYVSGGPGDSLSSGMYATKNYEYEIRWEKCSQCKGTGER